MFSQKVNMFSRQLQIVVLLCVIALAVGVSIALADQTQAAGQAYGQTGTSTQPSTTTPGAADDFSGTVTVPAAPAAGDQYTNPAPEPQTQSHPADISQPAFNNPESIIKLLQDSKAAGAALGEGGAGASFHEDLSVSVEGSMSYFTADGHIIPPDRMSMSAVVHTPGGEIKLNGESFPYGPEQFSFEARVAAGSMFVRPCFCGKWYSASLADLSDFDEDWQKIDFTQFIINPEFLGQETTKQGNPVYHIRISIDAAKVSAEAQKHVKEKMCDDTQEEISKLASSTITVDLWIGVNDKLVYQATEKFLNTDLMIAYDDMMQFYKWGEKVDISPPPPDQVVPIDVNAFDEPEACRA